MASFADVKWEKFKGKLVVNQYSNCTVNHFEPNSVVNNEGGIIYLGTNSAEPETKQKVKANPTARPVANPSPVHNGGKKRTPVQRNAQQNMSIVPKYILSFFPAEQHAAIEIAWPSFKLMRRTISAAKRTKELAHRKCAIKLCTRIFPDSQTTDKEFSVLFLKHILKQHLCNPAHINECLPFLLRSKRGCTKCHT